LKQLLELENQNLIMYLPQEDGVHDYSNFLQCRLAS
jgi:hypothetical protein